MGKIKKAGFTLVELLVVIAIIGVLSSIVISSLSNSRKRGTDAAIKTELSNLRSLAEIVYANLGNSYGNHGFSNICADAAVQTPATEVFNDANVQSLIDDVVFNKSGINAKCAAGGSYYVFAVPLKTDSSSGWCVDSVGTAQKITWAYFVGGDQNCAQANTP